MTMSSPEKKIQDFVEAKKRENPFMRAAFSGEDGTSEGGNGACRPKQCNARSLSRDVLGEDSCGGPEYSAPRTEATIMGSPSVKVREIVLAAAARGPSVNFRFCHENAKSGLPQPG